MFGFYQEEYDLHFTSKMSLSCQVWWRLSLIPVLVMQKRQSSVSLRSVQSTQKGVGNQDYIANALSPIGNGWMCQ